MTIDVKDELLENVLKLCFSNQGLWYNIRNKIIIIGGEPLDDPIRKLPVMVLSVTTIITNANSERRTIVPILSNVLSISSDDNPTANFMLKDVPRNATLLVKGLNVSILDA